ncbi:MAG TPA: helix-turn-helix domain-containing protein [Planctomycetota bacterium]|nr:helix-turn-helix domain-containing protein [Planctomycetota bacterium]
MEQLAETTYTPSPMEQTWAEFVRASRKRLGLTQTQLAQLLSVQPMQVSRWERGSMTPHPGTQAGLRALLAKARPPKRPPAG